MYSKYPEYPKPITPKTILPKIPKCKICKREMPSHSNVKAHFPQCIKNTVMFDCDGNYTEITKVVIDTIYEYYGYKGVILFLNYPIGNRRNHWGEGFYARLLFSAYKTILSSYIEALTSGDNETHKTVCNDTDRSNFNISRGSIFKYDMNYYKTAYNNIDWSIHAICSIESEYDIDYLSSNRFSLLVSLYEEESCKTILNDYFSQLSDNNKFKFCRALDVKIAEKIPEELYDYYFKRGLKWNSKIKKFTAELGKNLPELFLVEAPKIEKF